MSEPYRYCRADEVIPDEPKCGRLAQWEVPGLLPDGEVVELCLEHAEPYVTEQIPPDGASRADEES